MDDEQQAAEALERLRRPRSTEPDDAGHYHGYLWTEPKREEVAPSQPTPCRVDYLKEIARLDGAGVCTKGIRDRCIARFGQLPRISPLHVSPDCPCQACRGKWKALKASVNALRNKRY